MAYQPKSYRKFLATSVTAAVVASAVAPVAALAADENVITNDFVDVDKNKHAWAVEAIDYLVGKKAIEGKGNKTFDIHGNLTRAEAAAILARTLELDVDKNAKPNFSDTDGHWGAPEIAAIQNDLSGVIEGYQGKFNPNNNITRQELAKIIVEAYELELVEGADVDFPDNNGWGEDYVKILASNGIVIGKPNGNFEPNAYVSRGEAAVFFHRTEVESARVEVPGVNVPLTVDSVSATNATTLTITGASLDKLEADNIKVEGINVAGVTVSEDGKTATVALESALTPDEAVTVTVNGKDYEVTYKIVADSVKVLEATYDDDTKDQFVAFTVNGKNTTATELLENGYDVKFTALYGKGNEDASDIFKNPTTGELEAVIPTTIAGETMDFIDGEDFKVQITVTKGSDVIVSELGTITIKNIDLAAGGINDYKLVGTGGGAPDEYDSTTLVVGETAEFEEIKVKTDNNEETVTSGFTVKSSNEAIVSVANGTEIRAHGPGKATLTITYGGVSKTVSVDVKNAEREIDKVVVEDIRTEKRITSINAVKGNDVEVKVIALDQYGDEFAGDTFEAHVGDDSIINVNGVAEATGLSNDDTLTINAEDNGRATISFRSDGGYALPKASNFTVNVNEAPNVAKRELDIVEVTSSKLTEYGLSGVKDDYSKDATIDMADDKYIVLELNQFTKDNAHIGAEDLSASGVEVTVNQSRKDVLVESGSDLYTPANSGKAIVLEAGSKTGTATVTIKVDGKTYTKKITVVDEGYTIKSVSFKSIPTIDYDKTLDYKTALRIKSSGKDDIVEGINLSKASSHPIRIADDAVIYLDKNGNGELDTDETVLGSFEIEVTGDFTNASGTLTGSAAITGFKTTTSDDGTVIFKVLDHEDKVVQTTSAKVDY